MERRGGIRGKRRSDAFGRVILPRTVWLGRRRRGWWRRHRAVDGPGGGGLLSGSADGSDKGDVLAGAPVAPSAGALEHRVDEADVVDELRARGYTPGVVFDANAGYLLIGRYQHDKALSSQLDLPVDRVLVVPKGTPADPYILQSARDYGGQVVSRDQFRDWAEAHPEIAEPGHLIKGGYRNGKLWLDLETEAVA